MKIWFITGASRGLGAEITRAALERGDAVAATARSPKDVTARLGEHPNLLPLALDVTDEAQAHAAVKAAVARFGRIDVLVNNAGFGVLGAAEETSVAEAKALFETNVFGVLRVLQAVLPHFRQRRSGRVLNISSIGGFNAAPGYAVYASTKFALEGLSESLAQEVAHLGIKVTIVEPGYFRTDFLSGESLRPTGAQIADYAESVGKVRQIAKERNHLQPGDPVLGARAIVTVAHAENPPLRFALGPDTFQRSRQKLVEVAAELDAWEHVGGATWFPEGSGNG
ncbi:oxidoreductase [Chondromyces apiculatus]|uniref:3-oxoacyl-[acyl-carrier protein] reductase n=1 Tax=Chondromyces apiculatus DSM 436 TaxID=1192034 RepID=A0A017SW58_9BACT|nr:oxidoreductase [Chondromyces apiculatus]EYF00987.1 3-oxoacyl-[acyl-carrier protein] reductase [Chondromyces apiculatus DSM 436]